LKLSPRGRDQTTTWALYSSDAAKKASGFRVLISLNRLMPRLMHRRDMLRTHFRAVSSSIARDEWQGAAAVVLLWYFLTTLLL
jgi:hypothetical protein